MFFLVISAATLIGEARACSLTKPQNICTNLAYPQLLGVQLYRLKDELAEDSFCQQLAVPAKLSLRICNLPITSRELAST